MMPKLSIVAVRSFGTLPIALCIFASPQVLAFETGAAIQALVQKAKANLVVVKGGTFKMGDFGPESTPDKMPLVPSYGYGSPAHEVQLDDFSISKYKVTYADFDVYSDAEGKAHIATLPYEARLRRVPNVPAGVNWQEAKNYCAWLAKVSGLPFDLPT